MNRTKQAGKTVSDKAKWPNGTYAVEAGRTITVDGVPFVSLTRCLKPKERGGSGYFTPVECDDFTHLAAAAPLMAEALRRVVNQSDRTLDHDVLVSQLTLEACRAALRAAGVE